MYILLILFILRVMTFEYFLGHWSICDISYRGERGGSLDRILVMCKVSISISRSSLSLPIFSLHQIILFLVMSMEYYVITIREDNVRFIFLSYLLISK